MNGEWWIEDREDLPEGDYEPPEHTVAGTLNDSGAGYWSLETIGGVGGHSLHENFSGDIEEPAGSTTIWGVNAKQQSLSLLNCYAIGTRFHFPSLREGTQRWQVGTLVEGSGVWVDSETLVDEVTIEYQDLAAWAWDRRERGAVTDFDPHERVLTVSFVGNIEEGSAGECPVQLAWGSSANVSNDGLTKIWPSASFTIVDSVKIVDVAEKWVLPIGQLLSLLALSHCSAVSVRARIAGEEVGGHEKHVNLRFAETPDGNDVGEQEPGVLMRQRDMLATRAGLQDRGVDLTALLDAFMELRDDPKLSDALSHFLDSQARAETGDVDEALRYLFNAFENLHDARFDSTVEDSEDLEAEIKRLVKETAVEHRNEVADRLHRKKQKSMRHKLQDLVNACGDTATELLAIRPDLVAAASDARNEIAHANPKSANRWKRHDVLGDLQWLMRHSFLQQLKIKPSDCEAMFLETSHPFSRYVARQ